MELRELRSFCAVARLRSMSRAAEDLGIGQPTVSGHVKRLEEEMGVILFDRVRRPVQPTLVGAKLAELAGPLVEGIDALARSTSRAEEEGPVTVASTRDIIPHTLLPVVRAFRSEHPRAHLRIRSSNRVGILEMVAAGEVDMGIVPGPDRSPELDFLGLFKYERVLITPLGHPLLQESLTSIDQIAPWPLILMSGSTYTRATLEAEFQRRGVAYDVVVELDSLDVIKRYVALGMGVSVGPSLAIDDQDREELGIVRLDHLLPVEQAGVVTLRGKSLSTPAAQFISVLQRTLEPSAPTVGRR